MADIKWNHQGFMGLTRGFWTLCAVQAGVELDLFTTLDSGDGHKMTVADLAAKVGSDARATGMLVTALTSLGLLVRDGQEIGLTCESRQYLSTKSEEYYGHMLLHQSHIMPAWIRLGQAVKTGQRVAQATVAESDDDRRREAFLMGMFNNARYQAGEVVKALDLSDQKTVLDLGGGPGTYAAEFCLRYPHLSAVIFDLPGSEPVAKKILARLGIAARVRFVAGDFNSDPLPGPFDVVFISQVIHQESPESAAALVSKAAGSVNKGGLMVIQEFFVDNDLTGPSASALFALNMLVNTLGGQAYTYEQVKDIMGKAGLSDIKLLEAKLPPGCAIMVGKKD